MSLVTIHKTLGDYTLKTFLLCAILPPAFAELPYYYRNDTETRACDVDLPESEDEAMPVLMESID